MMYFSAQRGKQQQADGSLIIMADDERRTHRGKDRATFVRCSHAHHTQVLKPSSKSLLHARVGRRRHTRCCAAGRVSRSSRPLRATPPMSDPSHQQFVLKERARQQQQAKQLEQREKALAAREEQTRQQQKVLEDNLAAKEKQLQLTAGCGPQTRSWRAPRRRSSDRERGGRRERQAAELAWPCRRRAPTARRPSRRARRPSRRCSSWRRPTAAARAHGADRRATQADRGDRRAGRHAHRRAREAAVTFESLLSESMQGQADAEARAERLAAALTRRGNSTPPTRPSRASALRCRRVRAGRHGGAAGRHAGQPRP